MQSTIDMKIYDISQELFTCAVFPGDPAPEKTLLSSICKGDKYNLTAFSMCAHNGTHIDAPSHFIDNGKTVDQVELYKLIGPAYVAEFNSIISANDALNVINKASKDASKRILLKGNCTVSLEAALAFADAGVLLIGNESQTVGPENAPMTVHMALLGAEVVLLEGIRLANVPEGEYLLNAAPLNLGGCDGAPCRAVLIDTINE